jgi:hypothetical protein
MPGRMRLSDGHEHGMGMGMNPYGMPFPDTRQSMHPVGQDLSGLGPGGFMRDSSTISCCH